MKIIKYIIFPFLLFSFSFLPVHPELVEGEYIESFHSDIVVYKDGSMTVKETIEYVNEGKRVRGIYRDFPVLYKSIWGHRQVAGFELKKITKNGEKTLFNMVHVEWGKRIYIGNPDRYLSPGRYVYEIKYKTTRQLLFFKKHDELYWNVNGTQWKLPILNVSATVALPKGISAKKIHVEGYTGRLGEKGQNYKAEVDASGEAFFETTKGFRAQECFTIVVTWPKGFVDEPTFLQRWKDFIKDNYLFFLSILLLFLFLMYLFRAWIKLKKTQKMGPVIPLFYPPEGMCPGDVRYVYKLGYDAKVFAAEIVHMAVKGFLVIHCEKGFFSDTYTLSRAQISSDIQISMIHSILLDALFSRGDIIKLNRKNQKTVQSAVKQLTTYLKNKYSKKYFLSLGFLQGMIGLSFFILILLMLFGFINLLYFLIFFFTFVVFHFLLKGYTEEGLEIKREIAGFELFLSTTEEDRLKVIGTPPTKNPQLFEKYLPYAIALGVDKQWTAQFAPVFEKLEKEGHPYVPIWYAGPGRFTGLNAENLVTNLTKTLSTSSGSGGKGGAGGGRGGGGGGSW